MLDIKIPTVVKPVLQKSRKTSSTKQEQLASHSFFVGNNISLYQGDSAFILSLLEANSVDCVVTSPPYYGQRDYGVKNQIGLEETPSQYIERLMEVFNQVKRILKPSGSLWVNIGDTYWSAKGKPKGNDNKQKNRRFDRPQDKVGKESWCVAKQLLLIPHRFAIAMQEEGWIVRNDNVWHKLAPTPDPVGDRCSVVHEYVFHFVKRQKYYFDSQAVAVPSNGKKTTKPPPSVWEIPTANNKKKHQAVFPESLLTLPIKATCPANGILLDPFCGSGTALQVTESLGFGRKAMGIDLNTVALEEARSLIALANSKEVIRK